MRLDWKAHKNLVIVSAIASALLFSGLLVGNGISADGKIFGSIPVSWLGVALQVYILWAIWSKYIN